MRSDHGGQSRGRSVALKTAADLIADIGGTLTGLASKATDIMGHLPVACGDDHFGHEFTDGE
ncbi:hypothetical protein [Nocardia fusca]|uniref:hypothetical protein n=1 Tax=Nocardia fusca TaxID=941183 RepID=UPI0007A74EB4|nr:hypothetical protein [Nocardia fusca]